MRLSWQNGIDTTDGRCLIYLGLSQKNRMVWKIVSKGPFMEFIRGGDSISLDTVKVHDISTPASRSEKLAMLIHKILLAVPDPEFDAGVTNVYEVAIADSDETEGDAEVPQYDSRGVYARVENIAMEGIVAGAFGKAFSGPTVYDYDPPILYTKDTIYLLTRKNLGTLSTADCSVAIGYTLEKVSTEDFISALVE